MSRDMYQIRDGKVYLTELGVRQRYRGRYPELFPQNEESRQAKDFLVQALAPYNFRQHMMLCYPTDLMRGYFLQGLVRHGNLPTAFISSVQRLCDIWLEKDESIAALSHIHAEVFCLYWGYNEVRNRERTTVLLNVIEAAIQRNSVVWLFYKEHWHRAEASYPRFLGLMGEYRFQFPLRGVDAALSVPGGVAPPVPSVAVPPVPGGLMPFGPDEVDEFSADL